MDESTAPGASLRGGEGFAGIPPLPPIKVGDQTILLLAAPAGLAILMPLILVVVIGSVGLPRSHGRVSGYSVEILSERIQIRGAVCASHDSRRRRRPE